MQPIKTALLNDDTSYKNIECASSINRSIVSNEYSEPC